MSDRDTPKSFTPGADLKDNKERKEREEREESSAETVTYSQDIINLALELNTKALNIAKMLDMKKDERSRKGRIVTINAMDVFEKVTKGQKMIESDLEKIGAFISLNRDVSPTSKTAAMAYQLLQSLKKVTQPRRP